MQFYTGNEKMNTFPEIVPTPDQVENYTTAAAAAAAAPATAVIRESPPPAPVLSIQPSPSPSPVQSKLIWDVSNSQYARGNITATLYALQTYIATKGIILNPTEWKTAEAVSQMTQEWYGTAVNHNSTFMLDNMFNELGYVCGFPYEVDDKMLAVSVADTPEPIIEATAKWPKFQLDEAGFRSAMSAPNSFAAAVRWHAYFHKGWEMTGFETISTVYSGDRIQLTEEVDNNIIVCDDIFGYPTGSYTINSPNFIYTIRITDVTFACGDQVPTYDDIICAHDQQSSWRHDPKYKGFRFNSFKIDVTSSIQSILGAKNGDVQIVAAQAGGIVQINKQTPLNADVSTVSVARYRCFMADNIPEGVYVDFTHQDDRHFTNLVEIFVAHKSRLDVQMRMYDGLFNEESTVGSDK